MMWRPMGYVYGMVGVPTMFRVQLCVKTEPPGKSYFPFVLQVNLPPP